MCHWRGRLFLLLSVCLIAALAIGGCGPTEPTQEPMEEPEEVVEEPPEAEAEEPAESEPEEIKLSFVVEYSGYPEEAFRETTARCVEEIENINVDAWYGPWGVDTSYIKIQIAAGEIPDVFGNVFPFPSTAPGWYDDGIITDLTPYLDQPAYYQDEGEMWRDTISSAALGQYNYNGHELAIPYYSGGTGILWYNKTVFEGLGLQTPTTWEEFREVATTLKENGIYPISMQGMPYAMNHWFRTLAQRVAGLDKIKATAGRESGNSWTDAEFMEAAMYIQEIIDSKWIEPGFLGYSYVEGMIPIVTGQAGMMLMSESLLVEAGEAVDPTYEFDFVRWPTVEGGAGDPTGIGLSVDGWSISAELEGEKKEAAVKFLQCFLSPENAKKQADIHHYIIAILGANTAENSDEFTLKYASEILPASTASWSWWPAPTFGPNDEWVDKWGQVTVEWFNGEIGYEEFLQKTEDLANEFAE